MESTVVGLSRLTEKSKWIYSAHSGTAQQIERAIATSRYEVKRLGELSVEIADGLHGVRRYVDEGVVMLAVGNVTEYGLDLSDRKMVTAEEHARLKRSQVRRGDLLVTITGRLGTALIYDSDEPANLSAHVARVSVDLDRINPHYLAVYFNSALGKQQVEEFSIGSLYPHINVNRLRSVRVIVPPLPVQDRIARVMQDAHAARRQKLEQGKTLLAAIDESILTELGIQLTRTEGDKYFVVSIRKLAGGRFDVGPAASSFDPAEYPHVEWVPLRELAELPTTTIVPSKFPDAAFMYVGMTDVDDMTGEVSTHELRGSEINANKIVFRGNDVVFARIEPCIYNRKIALIPDTIGKAIGSTELLVARPKLGTDPGFLLWMLRSELVQQQIAGQMVGSTGRRRLPNTSFSSLLIPRTPEAEQRRIAAAATRRRNEAKRLHTEAEQVVAEAKARVERIILGEEPVE